jgi:CHAD domain-containing protein
MNNINETIIQFISEQVQNVADFSKKSELEQSEVNLHELRVACKKLKAMYQVLSGISEGNFDSKFHFEEVDKLFKAVGTLRDIHVQIELMNQVAEENSFELSEKFKNLFEAKINEIEHSVKQAITGFNSEKMIESLEHAELLIEHLDEKILLKDIRKLLKKRLWQIQKLLPCKKEEEKIHLMRKRVKQVCYVVDLLKEIDPKKNHFKNYMGFKEAAEFLGKWHDCVVLIAPTETYIEENIEDDSTLYLYAYLKIDEKKFLKKARKKLKKYF